MVISIILVLMGMIGSAVSAARGSQRVQATQALITKLDAVVQQHYSSYASRAVPGTTSATDRAIFLRRLASAELPDNWADVQAIANNSAGVPRTAAQSVYVGVFQALRARNNNWPTSQYADAECLFMIVIQSGLADCVDCGGLRSASKGDLDGDGAFEFLDEWGNPIRYVLWPAGLELPPGSGRFFSSTPPFSSVAPATAKGGTMRPLIFSCGPDKKGTIAVNDGSNFGASSPSENPPNSNNGGFLPPPAPEDQSDRRADNITNFDAEAKK